MLVPLHRFPTMFVLSRWMDLPTLVEQTSTASFSSKFYFNPSLQNFDASLSPSEGSQVESQLHRIGRDALIDRAIKAITFLQFSESVDQSRPKRFRRSPCLDCSFGGGSNRDQLRSCDSTCPHRSPHSAFCYLPLDAIYSANICLSKTPSSFPIVEAAPHQTTPD
jgi:hypothetical protein